MEPARSPDPSFVATPATVFGLLWSAYENGELLTMCAWCERVSLHGSWVAAPRSVLEAIDTAHTLSHGICSDCAGKPVPAA